MKEPFREPFQTHSPIFLVVEINEDHPNENKQRLFIQSKGVSLHRLHLTERQRQAEKWKNYSSKREGFSQVCPDWRLLAWGSWTQATRSGTLYVIGYIFGFLQLTVSWNQGQKLGKLSAINEALAIWGQSL